jgi:nicotinamide mononucleotide transporter
LVSLGPDEDTRPVTNIEPKWYFGYAGAGLVILGLFLLANLLFNPTGLAEINRIDLGLAVASGVAQLMLDNKKLPNWILWAGINIVSIPFFLSNGLTLVAFQYLFFLANTVIAYKQWKKQWWVLKHPPISWDLICLELFDFGLLIRLAAAW